MRAMDTRKEMNMLKSLAKVAVGVIVTPLAIAGDLVALGTGKMMDPDYEPLTARTVRSIVVNTEQALQPQPQQPLDQNQQLKT